MIAFRVTPPTKLAVVGSPAYFAQNDRPRHPNDLRHHSCVHYRWSRSGALYRWPFAKRGRTLEVEASGRLTVNDVDLLLAAALDGAGLICTLENVVSGHIDSGRLVSVLSDWCPVFPGFYLYYPSRLHARPALRALVDFVRSRARGE
jgi:DNA-binding transcriptional LysR family regulator